MAHDGSSNEEEQKLEEQQGLGALEQEGGEEEGEEAALGEEGDKLGKEELEEDIETTPAGGHGCWEGGREGGREGSAGEVALVGLLVAIAFTQRCTRQWTLGQPTITTSQDMNMVQMGI